MKTVRAKKDTDTMLLTPGRGVLNQESANMSENTLRETVKLVEFNKATCENNVVIDLIKMGRWMLLENIEILFNLNLHECTKPYKWNTAIMVS